MGPLTSRPRCVILLAGLVACTAEGPPAPAPLAEWQSTVTARIAAEARAIHSVDGVWQAEVAGLDVRWTGRAADLDGRLEVRTVSLGRGGTAAPVAARAPRPGACTAAVDTRGACIRRLETHDDTLVEWWEGRGRSLAQGWTVRRAPSGDGPVELAVSLAGHRGVSGGGRALTVVDANGQRWSVDGLAAWDADGRALDAALRVAPGGFVVEVDDADARYPIEIDPVYTPAVWSVEGVAESGSFGFAVEVIGDVNGDGYRDVAVGGPTFGRTKGRFYVFHNGPSGLASTAAAMVAGVDGADLGTDLDDAGDVDNDGYDDLIVGAPGADSDAGAAYLFRGGPAGIDTTPAAALTGGAALDRFGLAVAGIGDVNGDGFDDVAVGAPHSGGGLGSIAVFHGSVSGLSTSPSWSQEGTVTNGHFGSSVSGAGDSDGDGYADLVVGGPGADATVVPQFVWLPGSASGVDSGRSATVTASAGDYLGCAVDHAGDVNNDGYDDVIVGAWGTNSASGSAFVYHGGAAGLRTSASSTLNPTSTGVSFGWSVAGVGDVTGDGYDDVLVGGPTYSSSFGRAYLHPGAAAGVASTAMTVYTGADYDERLGGAVDGGADLTGDGQADMLVGASGTPSWGSARVFAGTTGTPTSVAAYYVQPIESSDDLGCAVSTAGDINGDGFEDLIVGARGVSKSRGAAYLYLGTATGPATTAAWTVTGAAASGSLGSSVASAGDVNGDGYDDIVIGAPYLNRSTGEAYVYAGSAAGLGSAPLVTYTGASTGTEFGAAVAGAGDVDNDGFDDIIIGAPTTSSTAGAAAVFHGAVRPSATPTTNISGAGSSFLGAAVASAGDVNGDGYDDVVVGAPRASARAGEVTVHHGGPSGVSSVAATVLSGSASAQFGLSITGGVDLDADGFSDVAIAGPHTSSGGTVQVHRGSALGLSTTPSVSLTSRTPGERFGASLTWLDIDGDGAWELAVGASVGEDVYVFSGPAGALDPIPAQTWTGEDLGIDDGKTLAAADLDGDGLDDLVVASPTHGDGGGIVSAFFGDRDADGDGITAVDDCDDTDPTVGVGTAAYIDGDGDGYGAAVTTACPGAAGVSPVGGDCDDASADVSPGATEVCDTLSRDENCDGLADDADPSVTGRSSFFADTDGDAFGDAAAPTLACHPPAGFVADDTDCDDTDAATHPGAPEPDCADPVDRNCDGSVGTSDADADGWVACADCDDNDPARNPGATEVCDALSRDDDCDGLADDADPSVTGRGTFFADTDGDSFGDSAVSTLACTVPAGFVADNTDCDDTSAAVSPVAAEVCDAASRDDDCDGLADDADPSVAGRSTFFADTDGDSFGNPAATTLACRTPAGFVADNTDCDDTSAAVSPAATEVCDATSRDDDCDGLADDADPSVAGRGTYFADADADAFGDAAVSTLACVAPAGFVGDNTDCDDRDPTTHPRAPETDCDDPVDHNCDGSVGTADADADGWMACADCADDDPSSHPGAPEPDCADPVDRNCDGSVGTADADADGWVACEDCDDADASRHPEAADAPGDDIDQDCDGLDAGPADTGEPDSGEPDSGEPDSGEPDSGEPDSDAPGTDSGGPAGEGGPQGKEDACGCGASPLAGGFASLVALLAVARRRRR